MLRVCYIPTIYSVLNEHLIDAQNAHAFCFALSIVVHFGLLAVNSATTLIIMRSKTPMFCGFA